MRRREDLRGSIPLWIIPTLLPAGGLQAPSRVNLIANRCRLAVEGTSNRMTELEATSNFPKREIFNTPPVIIIVDVYDEPVVIARGPHPREG